MSISQRFRIFRNYLKLTQSEFASALGDVSQANITDIEREKVKVSIDVLEKLHIKWKINVHWLLTGEGEMLLSETTNQIHYSNLAEAERDVARLKDKINDLEKQLELKDRIIELLEKK